MSKSPKSRIIKDIARKRVKKWLSQGYLIFELGLFLYSVRWNKLVMWILGLY